MNSLEDKLADLVIEALEKGANTETVRALVKGNPVGTAAMPDVQEPEKGEWVPEGGEFDEPHTATAPQRLIDSYQESLQPELEEVTPQGERQEVKTLFDIEPIGVEARRRTPNASAFLEEVEPQGTRREPVTFDTSPTAPVATDGASETPPIDVPTPTATRRDGRALPPPGPIQTTRDIVHSSNLRATPRPEEEDVSIGWGDAFFANQMMWNTVVSGSVNAQEYIKDWWNGNLTEPVPGYIPSLEDIAGYEDHVEMLRFAQSPGELERIKKQIERDKYIRFIADNAGWEGTAAAVLGGGMNPLYLVPYFGWQGRASQIMQAATIKRALHPRNAKKIDTAIRKTMVNPGFRRSFGEAFTGEVLTEVLYHSLDMDTQRTIDESFFNIAAGSIAGGILGGALSMRHMTPEQYEKAVEKLQKELQEVGKLSTQRAAADATPVGRLADEAEVGRIGEEAPSGFKWIPRTLAKLTPIRILASENPLARKLGALIGEQRVQNTIRSALETRIKIHDGGLTASMQKMNEQWSSYKGRVGSTGRMSKLEFYEEVGYALRNGDTHKVPEIEAAAKSWRREVLDPLKKEAQAVGLLGEDVTPKWADTYFPRMYNFAKIEANRAQFIDDIAEWLRGEFPDFIEEDLKEAARQITRTLVDGNQTAKIWDPDLTITAGSVKNRKVSVPDNVLAKYLINEPDVVLRSWSHDMATQIEMHKMFGGTELEDQLKEVADEWDRMIEEAHRAGDVKRAASYTKQKKNDEEVLIALRDRILGTYGLAKNPRSAFVRIGRAARNLNILRLLGGMTMSAFPDIARPLYYHGFHRYAKVVTELATDKNFRNMAKADMHRLGVANDLWLNGRLRSITEMEHYTFAQSKFEAGLETLVRGMAGGSLDFGRVSLMSYWNSHGKLIVGVLEQDALMRALNQSTKNAKKLARAGFSPDMVQRMKAQISEHGYDVNGLKFAGTDKWTDLEAAEIFEGSIVRSVDSTIVTPGIMDRPLWMSTELGKFIGQLKSFGFAATNRQLELGMRAGEAQWLMGTLAAVTVGGITYNMKRALADKEMVTDPQELLTRGIEYSGATGMGAELYQIMLGGGSAIGVYKGEGNFRWAKQGMYGSTLGPSAGLMEDLLRAPRTFTNEDPNAGDVEALRRLVPYQNLHGVSLIFEAAENAAKRRYGIPTED